MNIQNQSSTVHDKPGSSRSSRQKLFILVAVLSGSLMQLAIAVSPTESEIPYVSGDTIRWSSPHWHQVQSRVTGEFICQGGTSCRVSNGPYWVTEHLPDGSGSGWLINVVDAEDSTEPALTPETFADAVTVDGNLIRWPQGGWYQVQDTDTYTEHCFGNINFCRLQSPGEYKVTNHSLGLNTIVTLGQDVEPLDPPRFTVDFSGLIPEISWPNDGWYQIQTADTFETVCQGGTSCLLPYGTYNIINHTSAERWENYVVGDNTHDLNAGLPVTERPTLTRAECASTGGRVIGDIGDGAIHRPEYRCESGAAPIAGITYLEGESVSIEGEVCCV